MVFFLWDDIGGVLPSERVMGEGFLEKRERPYLREAGGGGGSANGGLLEASTGMRPFGKKVDMGRVGLLREEAGISRQKEQRKEERRRPYPHSGMEKERCLNLKGGPSCSCIMREVSGAFRPHL